MNLFGFKRVENFQQLLLFEIHIFNKNMLVKMTNKEYNQFTVEQPHLKWIKYWNLEAISNENCERERHAHRTERGIGK